MTLAAAFPVRLTFVVSLCFALTGSAATLPSGFSETILTSSMSVPTAMALAPDGRIFVCQQGGALRVVKNGALLATPFVSLTVDSAGERGLLGVAFDPDFLDNHYVYVYYTTPTPAVHNRISRFTAAGDVAAAGSEVVLLDLDNLSAATNHNGGAIHFGLDGKLYAAVGENANGANSQTLSNLLGKVLRMNSDGSIPADNPFFNSTTGNNRMIWSLGLRNPFTFGVHPNSGRIFINDVGQNTWEEINDGLAGANYGWPATEGATTNPAYVSPLYFYGHSPACAIAGGTFYAPEVRQFPSAHVESYFFSDLCAGWIHRLDQAFASNDFATAIPQPVDLLTGHDGSLFYLTHTGVLGRIRSNKHAVGDVNGDGETNAADVFYLSNYFYAAGPAPVQGGDVDGNGQLTAADLTYLTAYVYGRGPAPV
jgi:glucose/arabinose dehydrogenase